MNRPEGAILAQSVDQKKLKQLLVSLLPIRVHSSSFLGV